jgi:4-hydroxy-tetrahydrodipicolinate synthase
MSTSPSMPPRTTPPFTRATLRGTWGTLLLPIAEDESIRYDLMEEEIETLIASGVAGIYSNGSAGEFFTQSHAEYVEVSTILARACRKAGLPFQIGACHPFPQETLERIRAVKHLEPDAYQVILPDWFMVRGEEVGAFMERVCEVAAPAGVVLYNPPHAKRQLPPEEIGALARRFPGLLGVKVAGGDEAWYRTMRQECGDLSVFIPGHFLVTGLQRGAHGAYSNVACLHPKAAVAWNRLALTNPIEALVIQEEIVAFLNVHVMPFIKAGYINPAADKLLAAIGGWSKVGTRLRWPYQWIGEKEVGALREIARTELARFFRLAP